jgi:hypothetical protein
MRAIGKKSLSRLKRLPAKIGCATRIAIFFLRGEFLNERLAQALLMFSRELSARGR